jgi:hypothetical protein
LALDPIWISARHHPLHGHSPGRYDPEVDVNVYFDGGVRELFL